MARYVGDLTDLHNSREREVAARRVEDVARDIRNRKVQHLGITYNRKDISPLETQGRRLMSAWAIDIDVTQRGRHEK